MKHRKLELASLYGFGLEAPAGEKLVAEMAAAFTCVSLGIAPAVRRSDYIASWLSAPRNDERAIFRVPSQASSASDYHRAMWLF